MKTLLKVTSIIYIVFGIFGVIGGIILGIVLSGVDFVKLLAENGQTPESLGVPSDTFDIINSMGPIFGLIAVLAAIIAILIGIFGLKGHGGNKSLLTVAIILTFIELVPSLLTFFATPISAIFSNVLPILFLIGAFGTRKELK